MDFAKAQLAERTHPNERLAFHFNPTTIRITKAASYRHEPTQAAKDAPPKQFRGTHPVELQFSFLLDANAVSGSSVMADIQRLLDWSCPTKESRESVSPSPPELLFSWGTFGFGQDGKFVGHLTHVDANCVLFARDGTPTRAEGSISMTAIPQREEMTNPTSGGLTARQAHTMALGDSLASVAHQTYGNAALWRALALVNGIDDPLRIPSGTQILLPAHADLQAAF